MRFKKCHNRTFLLMLVILLSGSAPVFPGSELPEIQQITTHPGEDFNPAVSSDGKWLAFVSERSGNLDIWIKKLPHGKAVQITFHPSDDTQPVWSPDGKSLAFTSKRRDALGDIWIVNLDPGSKTAQGKPKQITHYLGRDNSPAFSPNGTQLVFVSNRNGNDNLWILNLKSQKLRNLTVEDGYDPAWSPDGNWILFTSYQFNAAGDLCVIQPEDEQNKLYVVSSGNQGCWCPDSKQIVFLRYDSDTNGDGHTTPQDNGSLWQITWHDSDTDEEAIGTGKPFQITTSHFRDSEPCAGRVIYFSSYRSGSEDIWSIPIGGLIPQTGSALDQYGQALDRFSEVVAPEALKQAILAYHRVFDFFPEDSLWSTRAWIQIGELNHLLRQDEEAHAAFEQAIGLAAHYPDEAASARLKQMMLQTGTIDEQIARCQELISIYTEDPFVLAETWLLLGDLYGEKKEVLRSLEAYTNVLVAFPKQRNLKAQAQLKIGDLFQSQGQYESAKQSYMTVLREFGDVPLWRKRGGDRLLALIQGSSSSRIQAFRMLIQEMAELPSLAAEAQLSIGRILIADGKYFQALSELKQVEKLVPNEIWAHARAKILQAQAYGLMKEDLRGILLLEQVMSEYRSLEGGQLYTDAAEALFILLIGSADQLIDQEDYALAHARLGKAMSLHPDDVQVHRKFVESGHLSGKVESIILFYENEVNDNPNRPEYLYGLGLALSYRGENNEADIYRSNTYLQLALDQNYRLVQPYQTLGYNYELLERKSEIQGRNKTNWFVRFGKTLISPFRWMAGVFRRGRDDQKLGYYELAIQALMTAMELNDESTNPEIEAMLAQNCANNFYKMGEFGYQKAYGFYQRRLDLDTTFASPLQKAVFFERAGHCGLTAKDFEGAVSHLKTAIQLYSDLNRMTSVAQNWKRLGLLYQIMEFYEEAADAFANAQKIDESAGSWEEVERGWRNIAYNYHLMGEPEEALRFAKKAEALLSKEGIPIKPPQKSKLRAEILGFSIPIWGMEEIGGALSEGFTLADEAAFVYGLIVQSYEALKAYPEAIHYEQKRFDIAQKREDGLAERISMNRLGNLHFKAGNYKEAWDAFYQSWEQNKKKKDLNGRWINAVNLGNVTCAGLTRNEDSLNTDLTIRILQEEETLREEGISPLKQHEKMVLYHTLGNLWTLKARQNKSDTVQPVGLIASTLDRMDLFLQAEFCFKKALNAASDRHPKNKAVLLKNLSEIHSELKEYPKAYSALKRSLQIFQEVGDDENRWRTLYGMAKVRRHLPDDLSVDSLTSAHYFLSAVNLLESMAVEGGKSAFRLSDQMDRWSLYKDAALYFVDEGYPQKGLEMIEKGRQRQAVDWLALRPPELKRERHKIIWGNVQYLRSRLYDIQRQIQSPEIEKEMIQRLNADKVELLHEYEGLMASLHDEDPMLAYLLGIATIDLSAFRSTLKDSEAAVSYLVGTDRVCIWILDSDTTRFISVPAERLWISNLIDMLFGMEASSTPRTAIRKLNEILIEPIMPTLEKKSTILIVPDDMLWKLPFEILQNENISLSDYSQAYTPSLMVYYLAYQRRNIGQEKGLWIGGLQDKMPLSIHNIVREVQYIKGDEATEEAVMRRLQEADLIHMDRKGVYSHQNPLMSAWLMRPERDSDGLIQSKEIYPLNLKASLFVAPEPVQQESASIGAMPFLYALHYAGIPSVLIPQWPHADEVEKHFYSAFYSYLKTHPIHSALKLARQDLRFKYAEWKDWAGFNLFGYTGLAAQEKILFSQTNMIQQIEEGRAYEINQEYGDALRSYETALDMASILKDSAAVENIYREIRRASIKGEIWDKTIFYQKKINANIEASGELNSILRSIRNLVAFYLRNKDYQNASQTQKNYISRIPDENIQEKLNAYEQLAFIFSTAGQKEEAIYWIDQVLFYYEYQKDSLGIAKTLIRKGRFLLEKDSYWDAYDVLDQSISVFEKPPLFTDLSEPLLKAELGAAYQLMGLTCEKLARYQEGQQFHEKGFSVFQHLKYDKQAALSQQYLADVFWKQGKYRNALSYQSRAMKTFEELDDQELLALSLNTQGLIYKALGDLEKAKISVQEALTLTRQLQKKTDEATILKNLGLLFAQEKRYRDAELHFKEAMIIDSTQGYLRGLSYDLRNLGVIHVETGQVKKGIYKLRKGLRISRSLGDTRNELLCLYRLGQAFHQLGDDITAEALLDSGVVLTSKVWSPAVSWMIYHRRAQVRSAQGRMDDALDDYEQAIELVEGLRSELKVEALQQGFIDDKMQLYQDVIRHLVSINRNREAFYFVERAKSRNFIDLLENQSVALSRMQNETLKKTNRMRMRIQEAQQRLVSAQNDSSDQIIYWEQELQKRRGDYQTFVTDLQIQNEELASFVSVNPLQTREVQALLTDSTMILAYFLTDENIFSWIVQKDDVFAYQRGVPLSEVQNAVIGFRESIQSYLTSSEQSQQLYQWLIQPLEDEIKSAKHLVIIPHGILHYLPFSALQNEKENYLIDSFSLSYIPSATVLKYCMDEGSTKNQRLTSPNVLALCNPELGSPEFNLPFAAKEAMALKRTFPNVRTYLGVYATEDVIRRLSKDYKLIHFASHGVYEPEAPLFSALLLSPETGDDGRLEAHEIFGLTLNCDMVTLSACETGLAHITQGDEVIGLARSFIYAGAPSIVNSLWKVDDLATAVFMKRFYRFYEKGLSKSEALRETQILIRDRVNSHPAAWAAFGLTGDYR